MASDRGIEEEGGVSSSVYFGGMVASEWVEEEGVARKGTGNANIKATGDG